MNDFHTRDSSTQERLETIAALDPKRVTSKALHRQLNGIKDRVTKEHKKDYTDTEAIRGRITAALGYLTLGFVWLIVIFTALVMVAFPAVEVWAVSDGIYTIKPDTTFAVMSALTFVVGSMVVLFITHLIADNISEANVVNWRKIETTERPSSGQIMLQRFYRTNMLMSFTIVGFGVIGRLNSVLTAYPGNIVEFAIDTARGKALGFMSVILMLIMTTTLIRIVDGIVLFAYDVFVSLWGVIDISGGDKNAGFLSDAITASQNDYLDTIIARLEAEAKNQQENP